MFARFVVRQVEFPDLDEVRCDEEGDWAGQAFALAEAVRLLEKELTFRGTNEYGGFFLVFGDPFAVAEVRASGLVVEVELDLPSDHIVNFFHVIADFGQESTKN